ncbi:hypothetical protein EMIHUDRAFT_117159 [Emiliania huxleyi CCMP1516]|uniref:DUF4326 domain-containing protein n=2 Tax=Emiliania huxleyi TaxID=2903 RepID=A0A0D3JD93_EMIH1|nr:hypothetical protein EMIHUDRAFT_117159 [Emiliania huxleyi CCMP1516]EOD21478.1 hypothetical protein EMIHUDRAFT_117159 [Emiliania huxleyi CCMP1516]|eukprot:XP_005773907.1 hypothetical protein EMIHUDRAFT_117159 [Emiliania huxleyi CCMP1516]
MASAELIAARKDKRKAPAPPKKDVAQAAKEPTASKGGKKPRQPSWEGLPICPAWKKDGACHAYRQRRSVVVVNKHHRRQRSPSDVDIRRGSPFGVLKRMLAGEQIRLVCACAPKRCHGDIIAARLRRMMREIVD